MTTYLRLDTNTLVKTGVELRTIFNCGIPYRLISIDEAMRFLKAEVCDNQPKKKRRYGGR